LRRFAANQFGQQHNIVRIELKSSAPDEALYQLEVACEFIAIRPELRHE
jgi:hypothetical protein